MTSSGHAGSARERPRPRDGRGALYRRSLRAVYRTCCTPGRCARRTRTRWSRDLDASPALAEPGVVTVLTQADVPGEGDTGANRHDEPLFPAEVMFHRQPVAWVLGETLEAAQRGAARVTARIRSRCRRS